MFKYGIRVIETITKELYYVKIKRILIKHGICNY